MNKSESIKNFASALSKFQGEVKNPPKSASNPFFKSKYTPLDALIDAAKPLLLSNDLSYIQSCSGDGSIVTVTTLVMHNSGEWVESEPLTLKADKATAQGAGSAITYARRYALAAVLGLASDEDDDGNDASGNKKPEQKPEPKKNEASKTEPANNLPIENHPDKASKLQVAEVFKAGRERKASFPSFEIFECIDGLLDEKKISTKFPYADKEKTKVNWTPADIVAIMAALELPF
jgi:hypothetical protein